MSDRRPAAVFVHGAGGGGWEWRVWARAFAAAGHAVSAPDLRPSERGLGETSFDDYLAQVRGWVQSGVGRLESGEDSRGTRPSPTFSELQSPDYVLLVGASLGGLLAASVAAQPDTRVAALVLVNPLPPAGLPAAPAAGPVREWGRRASLASTVAALHDADPFTTLAAWPRWRDESTRVLAEAHAGRDLPAPRVPCVVIASDGDTDVPPAGSHALAVAWGAALLRVPGSHVGPLLGRGAAGVAALALTWLNGSAAQAGVQRGLAARG